MTEPKFITCPICGHQHLPCQVRKEKYFAEEFAMLGPNPRWICIDCIVCGCQIKVQRVLPRVETVIDAEGGEEK